MDTKLDLNMFTLNFGPQHPAAHGVLRLIVNLEGEVIKNCDPHIGLLHRGTEKLIEYKTVLQSIPYFDRLDYVSMMSQEHTFSTAFERLLAADVSIRVSVIRTIFLELTRILNHLLALTTHALDVGAMTPFLWAFEEREKLMEFYERVSGARMHSNFIRPGGFPYEIDEKLLIDMYYFCINFNKKLEDVIELINSSRIWKQRLSNIGIISLEDSLKFGFSGPMIRSTGLGWDLRKYIGYEMYDYFNFTIPVGHIGDCFDRYLIRLEEIKTSIKLVSYGLLFFLNNRLGLSSINLCEFEGDDFKVISPKRSLVKNSMESLITHFKLFSEGIPVRESNIYYSTEAPKGELGTSLYFEDSPHPRRCKIRSPGYFHLQGIDFMARNHLIADLVTIIGTQDIVFGEIDR